MRQLWIALAAAAALASPQVHAAAVSYTGSLAIQIASFPPLVAPGAGVAIVNGSSGGGHLTALDLSAGVFATSGFLLPITDPAARPILQLQLTVANGPAAFAGSGGSGSFGGVMPLVGAAKVCLHGSCSAAVANLVVPLGVAGSGGFAQVTAAVNLTVIGAPWTTGTAAIGTLTAMGGVAPLSSTAMIHLVTPIFVSTNIGASAVIPSFGFLSLGIPEPGTFVLLAAGITALVAKGCRRVQR